MPRKHFFEGDPRKLDPKGLRSLFGADTTMIARYVIYSGNSPARTQEPKEVKANPFGLKNMLGNVMEYCADRYAEDAYARIPDGAQDPKGPAEGDEFVVRGGSYAAYAQIADGALDPKGPADGDEFVVRGGSYADDAGAVRCAARSHTRHDDWLRTDPQNPKSIWWYSDVKAIGFRIVCEVPDNIE